MKRKILAMLLGGTIALGMTSTAFAEEVITNEDGTVENPEAVEVDENKLVLWSLFSGGDGGFMDQIIADYNAGGPTKEVQSIMLVWADYYTKLTTAVATGNGPDIGISHASRLSYLMNDGVIEPLNPYLEELGIDLTESYSEKEIESVSDADGNIYAIPLDTHAEVLYYNLDILAEAGVEVQEDGTLDIKSVDDFNAICEKVKAVMEEGESAVSITSKDDDPWRIFWATYNQMGGSPILTEDWSDVGMDAEVAKKAAEFVKSIYDNGYALAGIEDHQKFFQAGTAGLFIGGTWARGAFEQTDGLNFGEMPWPQLFENPGVFADQHTFIIPVNPNRIEEETIAAVEFMVSASKDGGVTWAQSGQIPACKQVVESEEFLALPGRANLVSILDNAAYSFSCPTSQAIETDMKSALNEYWADSIDVDTLVEYLAEAIANNLP